MKKKTKKKKAADMFIERSGDMGGVIMCWKPHLLLKKCVWATEKSLLS